MWSTHNREQHPQVTNQNSFIHSVIHNSYMHDWQCAQNVFMHNIQRLNNKCKKNQRVDTLYLYL